MVTDQAVDSTHGPIDFLNGFCDFSTGPYVLMAVARKTHNPDIASGSESVYREVVHNNENAEHAYNEIRARCELHPYEWRVYVTANARDTQAAYFNFRNRMNSWSRRLLSGDDAAEDKMGNVGKEWVSELHRPASAATSYFTFDLDGVSEEDAVVFAESVPRGWLYIRESPNGYHVVTEPFEYPTWDAPVEYDDLDTDGQVHVDQITP